MSAFHLFTVAGIPVFISPFYLLLILMFSRGDLRSGVIWGVGITLSLVVHELGHALVARHLRHNPSITLHGFGGHTSRERTGRDVEEALIVAMGPAAGLGLALLIWGLWWGGLQLAPQPLRMSGSTFRTVHEVLQALLYPAVTWNILNLLPLWPLDGGHLLRLGVMRGLGARRADLITHGLAIVLLAGFLAWALQARQPFMILILVMLGLQNWQALRGQASSGVVHTPQAPARSPDLVKEARAVLQAGNFREAARLSQQARSQSNLTPQALDTVWEILGIATTQLGEHEEALGYLKRARPTPAVRDATERCLRELDRLDEAEEIARRWKTSPRVREIGRFLPAVLAFIVVAIAIVFTTPLSIYFL